MKKEYDNVENIVFVMLLNYQEYIIDNIKNLIKFGNKNIIVITEKEFEKFFLNIKMLN